MGAAEPVSREGWPRGFEMHYAFALRQIRLFPEVMSLGNDGALSQPEFQSPAELSYARCDAAARRRSSLG